MLVDDEEKLVELFFDNVMWGNIKINWDVIIREDSKLPKEERTGYKFGLYISLRKSAPDGEQMKKLISELAVFFEINRVFGDIEGELRNRDEEKELKILREENTKLKIDNKNAVEQLSQTKNELDSLKSGKPVDSGFHGFR